MNAVATEEQRKLDNEQRESEKRKKTLRLNPRKTERMEEYQQQMSD